MLPNKESSHQTLLSALKKEYEDKLPLIGNKPIASVYIGGGTPTLVDLSWIPIHGEVTVETNPEEVTPALLDHLLSLGVNRLSIGVQSLDDNLLKTLGRNHNAEKAKAAVRLAHKAGFENITIDLMYELPTQTIASWEHTLRETQKLPITHLSLYNLTFEPHTPFHKNRNKLLPQLPSNADSLTMLNLAITSIEEMGLPRYEISAFGTPSVHNTGYWTARPFLGLGPSAFSYWEGARFRNHCNLNKYVNAIQKSTSPTDFTETLSNTASINERLAVNLRLLKGVDLTEFDPLPETTKNNVDQLINDRLLVQENGTLRLTEKGTLFYDTVGTVLV
ncbi:MAG: Heme chaperone HemW [Chlamydiia bacterium]|nr:Heme chaperone HemW [Chlamydiia bacterium]MCH9615526.1 Heme chaperone HemW [Chlamydiia bacterium]MCH9629181.1 Heme chaperone HemW [Chlamydiia bacterium]